MLIIIPFLSIYLFSSNYIIPSTFTSKWQVYSFPLSSRVRQTTDDVPMVKVVPEDGKQVTSLIIPVLPVTTGSSHSTTVVVSPGSVEVNSTSGTGQVRAIDLM